MAMSGSASCFESLLARIAAANIFEPVVPGKSLRFKHHFKHHVTREAMAAHASLIGELITAGRQATSAQRLPYVCSRMLNQMRDIPIKEASPATSSVPATVPTLGNMELKERSKD